MELIIQHDHKSQAFVTRIEGQNCLLEYRIHGNQIHMNHTFVPKVLEGRGIAAKLVQAGINFANEKGYEIVPNCSYVAVYLKRQKN